MTLTLTSCEYAEKSKPSKELARAEFYKWWRGQDTPEQRGFSQGFDAGWAARDKEKAK